ncbi:regulatory LuxR family protein [Kribbella orskensis]|uniref:Regulatory LuxR family protein n=1 Tax=Kribbella orskensis TaxID=2512216 RepID=A0ABY2BBF2_9ACTN|nr:MULTISPECIES: response regulator transcription factor [Kribbella]TCN31197.1 regulatory LuxR family protein [Kribbella sp. VKM Ac-2500]TCO11703.1 regulatory LuxR family protein [Kribbella orskensis]
MDAPPACLMLTSFSDDEALFTSIMAGASGYLLKQLSGTDLVGAVRRLAAGESLLDPAMTTAVLERLRHPAEEDDDPRYKSLTEQERMILDLIAEGKTNRQIAQILFLAEKTVKKLRVRPAPQAGHGAPHRGGRLRGRTHQTTSTALIESSSDPESPIGRMTHQSRRSSVRSVPHHARMRRPWTCSGVITR